MPEIATRCFVIMPFSQSSAEHTEEYWTNHFNKFLKPLIEEIPEVEAYRVESLHGDILKQIITDLMVAPIVVAELTDHNPNVFWELGVRQSFKHNTITIAEEGTTLPFDISSKATIFYDPSNHLKLEEFRNKFKKAILDCINNPNKPDSYVLETISGRGTLYEILRRDEAIRRVEGLIDECKTNQQFFNNARKAALELTDYENTPNEIEFMKFLFSSIELLVSTRYLNEDRKFYNACREYNRMLKQMNSDVDALESMKFDAKKAFIDSLKKDENVATNRIFNIMLDHFERVYKNLKRKSLTFSSGI